MIRAHGYQTVRFSYPVYAYILRNNYAALFFFALLSCDKKRTFATENVVHDDAVRNNTVAAIPLA